MKQQSAEDIVDVNLQKLVAFVDGALEVITDFEGFCNVVDVRVDHDRIGVSIDDSELRTLRKVLGAA